jgi:predicted DNA-binding transcriptional regulator YafY
MGRAEGTIDPARLQLVPGTRAYGGGEAAEPDQPPIVDVAAVRALIDQALSRDKTLEMVYVAKNGQRIGCEVQPQRLAFKEESPVLVGLDLNENERRTFVLDRIERLRIAGGVDG